MTRLMHLQYSSLKSKYNNDSKSALRYKEYMRVYYCQALYYFFVSIMTYDFANANRKYFKMFFIRNNYVMCI